MMEFTNPFKKLIQRYKNSCDDELSCFKSQSLAISLCRKNFILVADILSCVIKFTKFIFFPGIITAFALSYHYHWIDPIVHEIFDLHGFGYIDISVVFIASLVSTRSYLRVVSDIEHKFHLLNKGDEAWYLLKKEMFNEQLFMILNICSFSLAIYFINMPIKHLWAINLIYFLFVMNNFIQSRTNGRLTETDISEYACNRFIHLQRWLKTENMPAVIGYSIIIILLSNILKYNGEINFGGKLNIIFYNSELIKFQTEVIKIFASGVAGYHLGLSTCSFTLGLGHSKVIEPLFNLKDLVDPAGWLNDMNIAIRSKVLVAICFFIFIVSTHCVFYN